MFVDVGSDLRHSVLLYYDTLMFNILIYECSYIRCVAAMEHEYKAIQLEVSLEFISVEPGKGGVILVHCWSLDSVKLLTLQFICILGKLFNQQCSY